MEEEEEEHSMGAKHGTTVEFGSHGKAASTRSRKLLCMSVLFQLAQKIPRDEYSPIAWFCLNTAAIRVAISKAMSDALFY